MIINQKFKNNKKAEKAAALLALSADKEGKHGQCLLPEEMAALVDATCTKKQREIFMQHLSGCENCYKEWLTLKTMDQKAGRKAGAVYHLSRFKKYSYLGSALAVAASVVVFLNITHLLPPAEDKQFQKPLLMQSQPASESVISESKEMEPPVPKPSAPVASDALVRERLENRDAVTDTEDVPSLKMKGVPAPASRSVPQMVKKIQPAEVFGESSTQMNVGDVGIVGDEGDPGDIDSWLEQLQKSCLAGKQDADFWEKMSMQGEAIRKKQAGLLAKDKEEKLSAVLVLLGQMDTKSVTNQCRLLLTLLAQEEKSR